MSRRAAPFSPADAARYVEAAEKGKRRQARSVEVDTVRGTLTITFSNGDDPSLSAGDEHNDFDMIRQRRKASTLP